MFHINKKVGNNKGFTFVEIIITIAIIVIVTALVFVNYNDFSSRSSLRVRVSEIQTFIRGAQERAGASEVFSTTGNTTAGFQSVRVKVRNGILESFNREKTAGTFTKFVERSEITDYGIANFDATALGESPSGDVSTLNINERYFVDVCFIDIDFEDDINTPDDDELDKKFVRESLTFGAVDCTKPLSTHMLCSEPVDEDSSENNNFDVLFSIEQPTREVHANVFPVDTTSGSDEYKYEDAEPNGSLERISNKYEGIRIVLLTAGGLKRSIDVYQTGLVSTKDEENRRGCPSS